MTDNRKKRPEVVKKYGIWIFLTCLTVGVLLTMVWVQYQHIRVGYDLSAALRQQQTLLSRQNFLKVEVARLKSSERIARIAKDQLGLFPQTLEQTVALPCR